MFKRERSRKLVILIDIRDNSPFRWKSFVHIMFYRAGQG